MQEVENLNELRTSITPNTSTGSVYVKEYSINVNKGGGVFTWRTTTPFTSGDYSIENHGTIIKSANVANSAGSWVREYDGYINVNFFGAIGEGGDYTVRIQRAIDFAKLNTRSNPKMSSSTVYIPSGTYVVSNLLLKSGVAIIGDTQNTPQINAKSGGNTGEYMFKIKEGPVFLNLSNLFLYGNGTPRGCFFFEAKKNITDKEDEKEHGGLWNSSIKNIKITGFHGHGIYLQGRTDTSPYDIPNQQNMFENIFITRASFNGNALKIKGQNGQISFKDCVFDGFKTKEELDEKEVTFIGGHNINIQNDGNYFGSLITFSNSACQSSDYGMVLEWAENIVINNCWFENTGVAITIINKITGNNNHPSRSVSINNCRFANAAGFGGLNTPNNINPGQCVSIDSSYVSISDCYTTVSDINDSYFNPNSSFVNVTDNPEGGVRLNNNSFADSRLAKSYGVVKVVSIDSNKINCFGNKNVFIQFSLETINTIESELNAGESMTIRANGGSIKFSRVDNIYFSTFAPLNELTLENGEIATFLKIDKTYNGNSSLYQLTSVVKTFEGTPPLPSSKN